MLEQSLGWIGNVFFILGVYMLGDKNIKGFYLNTIANMLYVYQSILMNNQALLWLSIGLAILNIKGIYQWRKKSLIESGLEDAKKGRLVDASEDYSKYIEIKEGE